MNGNHLISEDTQATLLLCGNLGGHSSVRPLTPAQYRGVVEALVGLQKRPSDLLADDSLINRVCELQPANPRTTPATPDGLRELLRRGVSLSVALDKWFARGIKVVGRADALYPQRLRTHLGGSSPAIVYYAGNESLLAGGGMALVGSRDLSTGAAEMIRKVVRDCVEQGMPIVSGGARGADQTAMQEGFSCGGKVIGALPCELMKACLEPANRDALAAGQVLLFSTYDPEMRPVRYGEVAMARNKLIYAMADACFVAQSQIGKSSGTWSGAVEELAREKRRKVYVYMPASPSPGCVDLLGRGALRWDVGKSVTENLATPAEREGGKYVCDDLFGSSVAEFPASYDEAAKTEAPSRGDGAAKSEALSDEDNEAYCAFLALLRQLLRTSRTETDTKKRLAKRLDLVPAQVKHWIARAEAEGVMVRHESPQGKRMKITLELARL